MLSIDASSLFLKDVKKMEAQGKRMELLSEAIDMLLKEVEIPVQFRDHSLSGNWKGYRELHIRPDWLLIYKVEYPLLKLARTGSHSELLSKVKRYFFSIAHLFLLG